jgi:hypothetical protein
MNECWSYGVMVSTLDSESSDPGSNPGMTYIILFITFVRIYCTVELLFFYVCTVLVL